MSICFVRFRIEVERLRIDYHISGLLTGTLPQLAQQNVFLGLPLQLLPEEVVVLVELGTPRFLSSGHV